MTVEENNRLPASPSVSVQDRHWSVNEQALAAIHVVHAIPGRVRLRVLALKACSLPAEGLRALLLDQTGVIDVTVNRLCGSVTVVYDPAKWTSEALCTFLQSRSREEVEAYASAFASSEDVTSARTVSWLQPWQFVNAAGRTAGPVKPTYWIVGYASMVLGIAGVVLPVVPGVPFLILSSYCFTKATPLKPRDASEASQRMPKASG